MPIVTPPRRQRYVTGYGAAAVSFQLPRRHVSVLPRRRSPEIVGAMKLIGVPPVGLGPQTDGRRLRRGAGGGDAAVDRGVAGLGDVGGRGGVGDRGVAAVPRVGHGVRGGRVVPVTAGAGERGADARVALDARGDEGLGRLDGGAGGRAVGEAGGGDAAGEPAADVLGGDRVGRARGAVDHDAVAQPLVRDGVRRRGVVPGPAGAAERCGRGGRRRRSPGRSGSWAAGRRSSGCWPPSCLRP